MAVGEAPVATRVQAPSTVWEADAVGFVAWVYLARGRQVGEVAGAGMGAKGQVAGFWLHQRTWVANGLSEVRFL